jgi:hypothetical protein
MTPQQMTQLQALVAKWRANADRAEHDLRAGPVLADGYRARADELEAALSHLTEAGEGEAVAWQLMNPVEGGWYPASKAQFDAAQGTPVKSRALYAHPAQEWQAMATAPRDGTRVLAYLHVYRQGVYSETDLHVIWCDDETRGIHGDAYQGWDWNDYEGWMPLPAAPKESQR